MAQIEFEIEMDHEGAGGARSAEAAYDRESPRLEGEALDLDHIFESLPLVRGSDAEGIVEMKLYRRRIVEDASEGAPAAEAEPGPPEPLLAAEGVDLVPAAAQGKNHHTIVEKHVRYILPSSNQEVREQHRVKKFFQNQLTVVWRFRSQRDGMRTTNGFMFQNGKIKAVGLRCDDDLQRSYRSLLRYLQTHRSSIHLVNGSQIAQLHMPAQPYPTMYNTDFYLGYQIIREEIVTIMRNTYPWIECHYEPEIYPAVKICVYWNARRLRGGEGGGATGDTPPLLQDGGKALTCNCVVTCNCGATTARKCSAWVNRRTRRSRSVRKTVALVAPPAAASAAAAPAQSKPTTTCTVKCEGKGSGFNGNGDCKVVTICIFQSGQVIITGGNNAMQVMWVFCFVNSLMRKHFEQVCYRRPYMHQVAPKDSDDAADVSTSSPPPEHPPQQSSNFKGRSIQCRRRLTHAITLDVAAWENLHAMGVTRPTLMIAERHLPPLVERWEGIVIVLHVLANNEARTFEAALRECGRAGPPAMAPSPPPVFPVMMQMVSRKGVGDAETTSSLPPALTVHIYAHGRRIPLPNCTLDSLPRVWPWGAISPPLAAAPTPAVDG